MPISVRCECGKKYQAPDKAAGKKFRCQKCGAAISVPRKKKPRPTETEDKFGFGDVDFEEYDDYETASAQTPTTRSRKRAEPEKSPTDLIVRIGGIVVFLGTLVNCAVQFSGEPAPEGELVDEWVLGVFPIVIVGTLGLYVAWVGENKNPKERRENHIRGLWAVAIGIGMIVLGGILTVVVTAVGAQLAGVGVVFTGLLIGGLFVIVFGLLGIALGRDPRELANRKK